MATKKETLVRSSKTSIRFNCPGSLILEKQVPEKQEQSVFAEAGHIAHDWAARALLEGVSVLDGCEDREMAEYCEDYARFVSKLRRKLGGFDEVWVEQKVYDIPGVHEGTSDFAALYDNRQKLLIVDFKYGQGVPVIAENNYQCLSYLVCVIKHHKLPIPKQAIMCIFQPRARDGFGAIRWWKIGQKDVKAYLKEFETKIADIVAVHEGEQSPTFKAGAHCFFCRAKPLCKTYIDHISETASLELTSVDQYDPDLPDVTTLTPNQLTRLLSVEELLKKYLKEAREYVTQQIELGNAKDFPAWKLVRGRSNRRFNTNKYSKQKIAEELRELGVENPYKEPELKGLVELEKITGKGAFGYLLMKPEGKLSLVPADDERPAVAIKDPRVLLTNIEEEDD